ncbi:MAG: beta-hydroxyacyl-ACP dehydratase [Phycisphaeraceae bacterium]
MRWLWLDRILELDKGTRCVAIRNVTAAEDVLHDHFAPGGAAGTFNGGPTGCAPETAHPAYPVMPNSLIIEGFAQTAGILTGHANDFKEKVILAKIGKAAFTGLAATPGYTLRHTASITHLDDRGASTTGTVELIDPADPSAEPRELATIDMMFSHIDQNMAGLQFPEENFVFTDQFMDLLKRSGVG